MSQRSRGVTRRSQQGQCHSTDGAQHTTAWHSQHSAAGPAWPSMAQQVLHVIHPSRVSRPTRHVAIAATDMTARRRLGHAHNHAHAAAPSNTTPLTITHHHSRHPPVTGRLVPCNTPQGDICITYLITSSKLVLASSAQHSTAKQGSAGVSTARQGLAQQC